MNVFQLLFVPVCAFGAISAVLSWRRGRSGALAALCWSTIWAAGGAAIAFPEIASLAARVFGITRGADLVNYLTILFLLATTRYFYSRHRQQLNMITELTRAIAISRAESMEARRDALWRARGGRESGLPS